MGYFNYKLGLNPPMRRTRHKTKSKPIHKIKKISLKQTERFHRLKHTIPQTIKNTIGPKEIIYGEHALKARFPNYLERQTTDYDIYSPTPKRDARQAEHALDKKFKGDFFYVKSAQHPGTYKVVSYANDEGYADFTKRPRNVPYEIINGKKYVKLKVEKQHRMQSLRDPEYSWRHGKDQDALNRIKIYEKKYERA